MKDRKDVTDSLMTISHDVGAPAEIVSDHTGELIGPNSKFAEKARFLNVKQSSCEPYTEHQNYFEVKQGFVSIAGRIKWSLIIVLFVYGTSSLFMNCKRR